MRLKHGRPDLAAYARFFDLAPAVPSAPLTVSWAGVTTLLIDDGSSAVMTDGFFSRPNHFRVATRPLSPSDTRVSAALRRLGVEQLDVVTPLHTHYDHALDSAEVARRTGALLLGGRSTENLGRGYGLNRVEVAAPGVPVSAGSFDITLIEGAHCPPDRFPGAITAPVTPPARASAYRCGEAWSTLVRHRPTGRSLLAVGSAGFVPGALAGYTADVVYLGVGGLGLHPERYAVDYWTETVRTVGARHVVLFHWDDFFRPLDKPLRALPFAADDLDVSMRILSRLAGEDGIALHLPTLWQPADPWR